MEKKGKRAKQKKRAIACARVVPGAHQEETASRRFSSCPCWRRRAQTAPTAVWTWWKCTWYVRSLVCTADSTTRHQIPDRRILRRLVDPRSRVNRPGSVPFYFSIFFYCKTQVRLCAWITDENVICSSYRYHSSVRIIGSSSSWGLLIVTLLNIWPAHGSLHLIMVCSCHYRTMSIIILYHPRNQANN